MKRTLAGELFPHAPGLELQMDATRWKTGDSFQVLDLAARLRFKSSSSLSFELGTWGDSIPLKGMSVPLKVRPNTVFTSIGWLDVHYSCEETDHRLQLRAGLPGRYVNYESMVDVVTHVKAALELPLDEGYSISIWEIAGCEAMEEPMFCFT